MRILIGGDVCPIGRNERLFRETRALAVARHALVQADITVVNLECPLVEEPTPIHKGGPALAASTSVASALAYLGIQVAGLANNHIMDHGERGLWSTTAAARWAGIKTVGAGGDIQEACEPLIIGSGTERVTLLAFAEREYSYATPTRPGACPLDLSLVVRLLRSVASDSFVVVLVHGGNEHYPYPNPWLQDTCRLMVELGAKAVICQHSHCIGAYEIYQGGLIVYGQGNLIFDFPRRYASWWEGLLVVVETKGTNLLRHEFVPVIQVPGTDCIRRGTEAENRRILAGLEERSAIVVDADKLKDQWVRFCQARKRPYQTLLFGYNRLLHVMNKLSGIADLRSRQGKMNIGNVLRCASHLEVLRTLYSLETTTGRTTEPGHG